MQPVKERPLDRRGQTRKRGGGEGGVSSRVRKQKSDRGHSTIVGERRARSKLLGKTAGCDAEQVAIPAHGQLFSP